MAFNDRHYDPVLLNEMLMNWEDYKNKIGFIALENRRYHPLRTEMFAIEHSDGTVTNYWRSKPEHALENLMPFIKQKPSYFGAVDNGRYTDDPDGDGMKNLTQLIPEINGRTILDYIHASKGLFYKPIRSKYQGTRKKASKRKGN